MPRRPRSRARFLLCAALSAGFALPAAAQTLETETARVLPAHGWEIGYALEVQHSSEGIERAMPFALVYGITNRLELMIEPVPYTLIRPKVGRRAKGAGDIETTLTYNFRHETAHLPALAIAGELKLPTARDQLIGTGQTDVAIYVSESKHFGRLDTHAHVAYTSVGQPSGVAPLGNIFGLGLAAVYAARPRLDIFAEVLSDTASNPAGEGGSLAGTGLPVVPEASGGEFVATVGTAWRLRPRFTVYVSGSRDNIGATLIRSGFVVHLR